MLKKTEVLAILERGGSIHVDTISRTARVVDVSGEWLDCCRYDVAERIEHSDGYRRRKTDWFATYYIEIDPPAEEAREDMTIEEIEANVARIVRGVIGKAKAEKMMASNRHFDDCLEVFLCHGGCCLGDAIEIQEAILAAGYFIPGQMGNAVIHVTARDPEAQTQEQEQPAQEDDLEAQSARVYEAVKPFAEAISQANVDAAQEEPEETAQAGDILAAARADLESRKDRSAWDRGVTDYALELLDELEEAIAGGWFDPDDLAAPKLVARQFLNGAADWSEYSWGGCSLIYDGDIAERLCSPSELKKTRGGERRPNGREEWLDVQARALHQAARRLYCAIKRALDLREVC